jgi:hypothetical protein
MKVDYLSNFNHFMIYIHDISRPLVCSYTRRLHGVAGKKIPAILTDMEGQRYEENKTLRAISLALHPPTALSINKINIS